MSRERPARRITRRRLLLTQMYRAN
jgi:hypothetical protein